MSDEFDRGVQLGIIKGMLMSGTMDSATGNCRWQDREAYRRIAHEFGLTCSFLGGSDDMATFEMRPREKPALSIVE